MEKYYYRWKDPKCKGVNPEWVSMTGDEFYAFTKSPGCKGRYFVRYDNRICEDDDIIVIETTKKAFDEWAAKHRHERYLDWCMVGHSTVSLQSRTNSNEGLRYDEIVADEDINIEEDYFRSVKNKLLKEFFSGLSGREKALIDMLYISNNGQCESKIAEKKGIPQKTINNRKLELRKKLEIFLAKNGF